jgi:hypothetical protein
MRLTEIEAANDEEESQGKIHSHIDDTEISRESSMISVAQTTNSAFFTWYQKLRWCIT